MGLINFIDKRKRQYFCLFSGKKKSIKVYLALFFFFIFMKSIGELNINNYTIRLKHRKYLVWFPGLSDTFSVITR